MRVIQAGVSVLTIPITSAACSCAAVAFTQYSRRSAGMTMRQTIALADKGWTDPTTYLRLLFTRQGLKRYGSLFLFLAIALNVLGGILQPLQQIFVSQKTTKAPDNQMLRLYRLMDITDQFRYEPNEPDDGLIVLMTREALATTMGTEPVAQLWQGSNMTCTVTRNGTADTAPPDQACGYGATLGAIGELKDPFLAQLPNTFGSGLIRQFLPRFNSTSSYTSIDADEYPHDACDTAYGGFWVRYLNFDTDNTTSPWSLEICVPGTGGKSPWESTRSRQDFSESLYLNLTTSTTSDSPTLYRMTVNTTGGYFELPNYMNGNTPGPLLATDPNELCDDMCQSQGIPYYAEDIYDHNDPHGFEGGLKKRTTANVNTVDTLRNKGPLLTIAIALFGEGSFVDDRLMNPSKYITANNTGLPNGTCTDLGPLRHLYDGSQGYLDLNSINNPGKTRCLTNDAIATEADLEAQILDWLSIFTAEDSKQLEKAFNAAAFLATQAWMQYQAGSGWTLTVSYELGTDTQVPVISRAGMVLISALMAIFLLSLFALALYASLTPRWTHELDSFAMIRIGAAVADKVPLMVGRRVDCIRALDEMPGWIGDAEEQSDTGSIRLGANAPLKMKRRYVCYDGDHEEEALAIHMSRNHYYSMRMREFKADGIVSDATRTHSR